LSETFVSASRSSAPRYIASYSGSDEREAIICHEYAVPEYIEPELERLYHNIFSALPHFKAYGGLTTDTCTYIARQHGKAQAIFLFRRVGGAVIVLNEGMSIDEECLSDFSHYVFSRWESAKVIVFQAVHSRVNKLNYPMQRYECSAQVSMPLPDNEAEYLASLGKNMRRNIRRYLRRMMEDHPSFSFKVYAAQHISQEHMHEIFQLSRSRIAHMNRGFALDDEAEKIFYLAHMKGVVGVATINGKVCGGMIGFRAGNTYFAKLLGHDTNYKAYSLGTLCCYLMIVQCMKLGCREFNFMWNEYPYKAALGGKRVSLDRLVIYRSRKQMLRNSSFAARVIWDGWRCRISALMDKEDMQSTLSPMEKISLRTLLWIRKYRRWGSQLGKNRVKSEMEE